MADTEKISSGEAYTFALLEEWKGLMELGREFRVAYLESRCDPETINLYVGALTNFYEVLSPKVKTHIGEDNWKTLVKRFEEWRDWVRNPSWFQYPSSVDKVFEFRDLLGDVVEKLDVTYFPKAAGRQL